MGEEEERREKPLYPSCVRLLADRSLPDVITFKGQQAFTPLPSTEQNNRFIHVH